MPFHYPIVELHRRRLPHVQLTDRPVFLTWRLANSLPAHRPFERGTLSSGRAFVAMDRLLDQRTCGPVYLSQPAIASMVVEAIHYNAEVLDHYEMHAFAIMPNHVHMLITPGIAIPKLMKSLKSITAKRANALLQMTGRPFWQDESYDHVVRNNGEFERILTYIERNPVRAGLVAEACDYPWSSAGWATRGSPADRGSAPQLCKPVDQ